MFIKILKFFFNLNIITNQKNPILLFPGLGGSRLIMNEINNIKTSTNIKTPTNIKTTTNIKITTNINSIDIWPPKLKYYLFNYKKWLNNTIVKFDGYNFIYNLNVKTLEFGDLNALDLHSNIPYIIKKNFYDNIINSNHDVFPMPYDFRLLHNKKYVNNLNLKIKKYIESFDKPVTLLTHSCGGLVVHYFLSKQNMIWKCKHINKVIYVNVPFGSLIKSLENLITKTPLQYFMNKELIKSLGGIIINLPNNKIIKPILIVNNKEIDNYYMFFNLLDLEKIIKENNEIINSFSKSNNVKTILVYTSNVPTSSIININNNKINIIKGPGDGTVPLVSLLHPLTWKHHDLEIIHLPNYEHSSILFSKELINLLN